MARTCLFHHRDKCLRRGIPFDVQETNEAYAQAEYGVTPPELAAAGRRVRRSLARG